MYQKINKKGTNVSYQMFPPSRRLIDGYDVVVVGAGTGGLAMAHRLAAFQKVLVLDAAPEHHYQPGWTLAGGGKSPIHWFSSPTREVVATDFLTESVVEFWPHENAVITSGGRRVSYKHLIVAAGLETKIDQVKGLKKALGRKGVSTNYVYPYPVKTWEFVKYFPGGNAIFTHPATPIKCAGASQKIMYLAEEYWRRHVGSHNFNISFISGQPKLFSVPKYEKALLAQCADKGITDLQFGLNLTEVRPDTKEAVFTRVLPSSAGQVGEVVVRPYTFLHVTPPQGPHDFIKNSPIANSQGWVDVDAATLQHMKYPNVWSLGDCSSLPTSKTAAAVSAQAEILYTNITHAIAGELLPARYTGYTACPLTVGNDKVILAEFDYELRPQETFWFDQAQPSRLLYWFKKEHLPHAYFEKIIGGKSTNQAFFKSLFSVARRWRGVDAAVARA
jgi:sulfide:quinone oxidoreductase